MSIEDLLSHSRIWRGRDRNSINAVTVPTGFKNLDQYLPGGGWPLHAVTEVFLDRYGVGELSLLMPALSLLSNQTKGAKQWIVWIAPPYVPYAPALLRHGVDLNRILLVHPTTSSKHDALWATEQVIRSQSSTVALAWLDDADTTALRRIQLGAEEHKCWTVLFRPVKALNEVSPARLRIKLSQTYVPSANSMTMSTKVSCAQLDILKCWGRRPKSLLIENVRRHVPHTDSSG